MQVMKFGGTSVANAENMARVVAIVADALKRDRTILVCSAISKCTDTLIETGRRASGRDESYLDLIEHLRYRHLEIIDALIPSAARGGVKEECESLFNSLKGITKGVFLLGELSETSLDAIQSFGELLSTKIITAKFISEGIPAKWIDSREIVRTSGGIVDTERTYALAAGMVAAHSMVPLFVLPGFIASDEKGRTDTLGRGGSDYSASLFAVGTKARILEIWTDVPGMMTTNPKIVPTARTISHISYRAALELSHFGAKVIYPPTIQPVVSEGIPIYVKNTFEPEAFGTMIESNPPRNIDGGDLIGISNSDDIALISLEGSGMVGVPGFSSRLFDTLSRNGINIILITQASSVHTMCIAIEEKNAQKARKAADDTFAYEISLGKLNPLKVETGYSIVCLVGDDVISRSGATGRMLAALGRHGIKVRATAQGSSERNISAIVPSDCVNNAIKYIHNEFFDKGHERQINLCIAGYGTVGRTLVKMIGDNADAIASRTGKRLNLCGLSNSRRFIFDADGLDFEGIDDALACGEDASADGYFERLGASSLENSIFVDCTANSEICNKYVTLIAGGYSIVACNKILFSAPYGQYRAVMDSAVAQGVSVRYETTVGAALPILETVSRCVNSGDRITRIEAVLSGTLNYLFSSYEGHDFGTLVSEAQRRGYTEPDPAIDLSGKDVLRKIVIIARQAGIPLEQSDVVKDDIPSEDELSRLYEEASSKGNRLRYVATLECDCGSWRAFIGVREVGPSSPLHSLTGTDNAAVIQSADYPSPMVIRGAGAGPRQTAGGLLNDILI